MSAVPMHLLPGDWNRTDRPEGHRIAPRGQCRRRAVNGRLTKVPEKNRDDAREDSRNSAGTRIG